MRNLFLVVSAGALLASPSVAQSGPVAKQSSADLVCQLTGDCGGGTDNQPLQDKGKTRGFSIAKPGVSARPATSQAPAATAAPRNRATAYVAPRRAQPAAGRSSILTPSYPVGRTDLAVTFMSGSATLTEQGRVQADQFAKAITTTPKLNGARFTIEGHTDAVGTREYNLDLSQRRAQSLVDYLAANGVNKARFDVKGYGFDRPVNARNPKAASNRRVEVAKVN